MEGAAYDMNSATFRPRGLCGGLTNSTLILSPSVIFGYLLKSPFGREGTIGFLVHHIHAFMIHVTVMILMKGVLFVRSSRLILDKANLGFCFPCDGLGMFDTLMLALCHLGL
jgi:hypothetical protein